MFPHGLSNQGKQNYNGKNAKQRTTEKLALFVFSGSYVGNWDRVWVDALISMVLPLLLYYLEPCQLDQPFRVMC